MDILDRRPWPERLLSVLDESDSPWSLFLELPAWVYRGGALVQRSFRSRGRLPQVPLSVGIGNLRVGGTGKTPLVSWLGQRLAQRGLRVAIVSRGYRAQGGGDEPVWLQEETGALVVLDKDRRRAYAHAVREGAQVVLLDDSLQSRDEAVLQLAVVLARDLMSPPRVLPSGPARESMRALARCQLLLVRREEGDPLKERLAEVASDYCERVYFFRLVPRELIGTEGRRASLSELAAMGPCLLLSGLARPQSFEADARQAGAQAIVSLRHSDHASFDERDTRELESVASHRGARFVLCPEKNFRRLAALKLTLPMWALRSEIAWDGDDPLQFILGLAGG